ncbi:tetratricopeptide repeat protein [Ulvibacterium marinum]|uniref:Tetratricopeptide repeat protein n=1 Tax=Ulvibacterium marinum TaxID=2419782 RepID=A0A3B0C5A7_9FLAO|nr:tetratricopeptide repeat protein [Ulvibacterium marinum]RKN81243.1 tetratricopeptide repeat protein [Ulvibacterium marinum]
MKNRIILFSFILLFPICAYSQHKNQERIDSLFLEYKSLGDGVQKIEKLEELYYEVVYTNPLKGLDFAKKGLKLSKRLKNWDGIGIAYYHIGAYHKLVFQADSARYYYNRALKIWKEHPNEQFEAITLGSIAALEYEQGNIDNAIALQSDVNKIFKEKELWLKFAVGLGCLGDFHHSKGNYMSAYKYTIEGLRYLDTISEEPWRDADSRKQLGIIEFSRGNFHRSLEHLNDALKRYKGTNDSIYMGHTYIDIGNATHSLKEYDSATYYYNRGLKIGAKTQVLDIQANALMGLGKAHTSKGDYETAIDYLLRALEIDKTNNTSNNLALNLTEIGNVYRLLGKRKVALNYLNQSLKLADSIEASDLRKEILHHRAVLYQDIGEYTNALTDFRYYQSLKDSIFNTTKSQQIEELKTIYETEKKEAAIALQQEEIKTLNEKAKVDKLTKGMYAGGMFTFISISGLLFFGFRQRIRKNRIAREKQETIYKQEIAHKKKELTSQTLHLVQKNTFIHELMENLENIKNSPEKFKMEFRRIIMLLKKENASDKDWEVFKTYFAEVHNDFDQKLKTLFSDISEKEIRLAAFLRMNLTTKEIAATLNVLPDSILKSKYRLKKKLGLPKETDLNHFLNGL